MEPTTAPYTTGNDILQYQGNANLAEGSGQAPIPTPHLDLSGVESTVSILQNEEARMRYQKYLQQKQDAADLAKTLSDTGGSAFNMKGINGQDMSFQPLPEDMPILNQKANDLRTYAVNHKSDYATDPEFYKKMDDYKYHVRQAGIRSIYAAQAQQQKATLTNPDDQSDLDAHVKQEIGDHKLTDFHNPEPFLQPLSWSEQDFFPKDVLKGKDYYQNFNAKEGDNDIVTKGLKNELFTTGNYQPGTPLYPKAVRMSQSFYKQLGSTNQTNPTAARQEIDELNKRTDQIAAERGIQPPPHIADIDENGKIILNRIGIPNAVNQLLLDHYGRIGKDQDETDKLQKQKADEANKQQVQALAQKKESESEKNIDSEIAKRKAEIYKLYHPTPPKATAEDKKEEQIKEEGITANRIAAQTLGLLRTQGQPIVAGKISVVGKEITDLGIDPAKYKVTTVPISEEVKNVFAEPGVDLMHKENQTLKVPDEVFHLQSDKLKNDILIGKFKVGKNEDGSIKYDTRIVPANSMPQNIIKSHKNGGKPSDMDSKKMDAGSDVYSDPDHADIWTGNTVYKPKVIQALGGEPEVTKTVDGIIYHKRGNKIVDDNGVEYKPNGR